MTALPQIPYYHIDRVINSGGTAVVYWGIDLRSGLPVAIKAIYPSRAGDQFILQRFREEANHYLYLSSHPNITKLVDFVEYKGQFYLVMEYIEGMSLDEYQYKRTGPLVEEVAIPMFLQILDTIGYLHDNNLLHLDIKPGNIMVMHDCRIKILDMGISAKINDKSNNLKTCGTPAFMPPEQFEHGDLGTYTDIFALGVTLFSMLTNRLPFSGSHHIEIWQKIKESKIPSARDFYPPLNPAFQPILEKAMHKNYWNRYQRCDELATELKQLTINNDRE
ncbi:MAG: serine/threonine protein kinase [Prevotellaceae bacterium]|jgi:serine/threonine-protein kinase|nr:serine/threonine protein kinase [Prevotellaceae bacterium]